jgi:hypothetical protein
MRTAEYVQYHCRPINPGRRDLDVHEAFPVLLGSPVDAATSWAGRGGIYYQYQNLFDKVYIRSLDRREHGGRAYKVIIETHDSMKFMCDLREKALMDVILNTGIRAPGVLIGEFTWVQVGSQCTLMRVGSEEHKLAMEQAEVRKNSVIPKRDLIFGHVYETKGGNKAIYLGEVYRHDYHEVSQNRIKSLRVLKNLLFYEIRDDEDIEDFLKRCSENSYILGYKLKFQNSHAYRADLGSILRRTTFNLTPEYVVDSIRTYYNVNINDTLRHKYTLPTYYAYYLTNASISLCESDLDKSNFIILSTDRSGNYILEHRI